METYTAYVTTSEPDAYGDLVYFACGDIDKVGEYAEREFKFRNPHLAYEPVWVIFVFKGKHDPVVRG